MTTDNKTIVAEAFTGLVASRDIDALARVLHEDFVHHRPDGSIATKREWLTAVAAVPLHDLQVEILHILADGSDVAVHSRRQLASGGPAIVVVDLWRLDHGLITEGWEVIELTHEAADHAIWWEPAHTETTA